MRVLLPTAILLGIVFVAIAPSRPSAQTQSPQAGITSGEKLGLSFDDTGVFRSCTVIEVRGDFVGCRIESSGIGRPAVEHWYNLRLIKVIERPVAQR